MISLEQKPNSYSYPWFPFITINNVSQQYRNAPGFVPVIINVQLMTDLKLFLGLKEPISPQLTKPARMLEYPPIEKLIA